MVLDQVTINAAQNGDLDTVKKYIENGGTVNDVDKNGFNLLYYGLKHINVVDYLLSIGASPNVLAPSRNFASALYVAIYENKTIDVSTLLINKGAVLNKDENVVPNLPYLYDDSQNTKDYFELLFQKNILTINAFDLHQIINSNASDQQSLALLKYMIDEKGGDIESRASYTLSTPKANGFINSSTLLHVACNIAKLEVVNYLIFKRANGTTLDGNIQRPIDFAVFGGNTAIDNQENIAIRTSIINALLDYCGNDLEKLGWFDEWKKDNNKQKLRNINLLRPLLAEPIEHFVLTKTNNSSLEACLERQNATLQRIAEVLEKSLNLNNQNVVDNKKSSTNAPVLTNFFPSITPS